jgi:hypothetical protein
MFLTACFKAGPTPVGGAVTIELSAPSLPVVLTPALAATITATVYDQTNQGVTWTLSPVNFGTLSTATTKNNPADFQTISSVTYTAPTSFTSTTTLTLTATSVSNPSVSSSLTIKTNPIVVSLTNGTTFNVAADQTIAPGEQLPLVANATPVLGVSAGVSWSVLPDSSAGSLTNQTPFTATYVAPSTVTSPVTATVVATSLTSSSSTASLRITVLPSGSGTNVAAVTVNGGPVPNQIYPNAAFTSVTICSPGSATACQTVDGVLVDTGSYGLRIIQSQIPQLKLPTFVDGNGGILQNCASNLDGSYLWGTVSQADFYIADESTILTSPLNIQVIGSAAAVVPDGCANGGTALNTPQLLGANGILGIGPEPTDCTLAGANLCDGSQQSTPPNLYYTCLSTGCTAADSPVIAPALEQVTNPVAFLTNTSNFSSDNNGVILQLPSVSGAESSVTGTLIFGIATSSGNNSLGNATVLTLNHYDNFKTVFGGQTFTNSFFDSGSNAVFFPDSLPTCSDNTKYFCPASLTTLSAQLEGETQGQTTVNFSVDNADSLLSNTTDTVFSTLAGPDPSCLAGNIPCTFDWGLPFFYGRSVFTSVDGKIVSGAPTTPWFAY